MPSEGKEPSPGESRSTRSDQTRSSSGEDAEPNERQRHRTRHHSRRSSRSREERRRRYESRSPSRHDQSSSSSSSSSSFSERGQHHRKRPTKHTDDHHHHRHQRPRMTELSDALIEVPTQHVRVAQLAPHRVNFLDIFATFVVAGGMNFDADIRAREKNNPHFAFLFAPEGDAEHVYYRWRVFSLLQGDSLVRWRESPFAMQIHSRGIMYTPPPPLPPTSGLVFRSPVLGFDPTRAGSTATGSEFGEPPRSFASVIASVVAHLGHLYFELPDADAALWHGMLRRLVAPAAAAIEDAMVFALQRSECAYPMMVALVEALLPERSDAASSELGRSEKQLALAHATLARLFLLHDIVVNGNAVTSDPNATPSAVRAGAFGAACPPTVRNFAHALDLLVPHIADAVAAVLSHLGEWAAPPLAPDVLHSEEGSCVSVLLAPPGEELLKWFRWSVRFWQEKSYVSLAAGMRLKASHGWLLATPPSQQAARH